MLFLVVILVLRPMSVFWSAYKSELKFNEKLFISWVGPRGIVAAGIASLFGLKLTGQIEGAEFVTPLVFMIVLGTVLLNATTARLVAKMLKVILDTSDGVLILGINKISMFIAEYLRKHGRHVVLIDNNVENVQMARAKGFEVFEHNVYFDELGENLELLDIGFFLAMTSSPDLNRYAVQKYSSEFGENGTYRLISAEEMKKGPSGIPEEGLFSCMGDFINLGEIVRDNPKLNEVVLESKAHFDAIIQNFSTKRTSVPLFLREAEGKIKVLTSICGEMPINKNDVLVYAGKELDMGEIEVPVEAVES